MKAAAIPRSAVPTPMWRAWFALLFTLALAALPSPRAFAQQADPPALVGRVSEVIGDAWLFDVENKEWTRLARNQTVADGDRLRTDDRARIALRIGSSTLWVDEQSDLEFARLDEGQVLLQLDKGDLALRLRTAEAAAEYRVQLRDGVVYPEREGLYRVEQLDRGTRAYAMQGALRFEWTRGDARQPLYLQAGEQIELWWANGPRAERQRLENDSFGDWVVAESRQEGDLQVSRRYVSPEMTGAEDLDRYGRWESAGEYGDVWIPQQVAPDWAPYRYGHWAWTRYWGWAWVDDSPWGFAPFHYGRWVQWRGRWCWAPGRYVARPVYAPALVAWVGGPSIGVGITIGGRPPAPRYGWYPLAPREVYRPHYHHTHTYEQRLNGGHRHGRGDGDRPHRNRDIPGAISYLPGQGGPVRVLPPSEVKRQLPTPPGRGELSALQGRREAPQPRAGADLNWRSEQRHRRDRDEQRGEHRGEQRGERDHGGWRGQPPVAAQPAPIAPVAPVSPAVIEQRQPGSDGIWRGRDRDRPERNDRLDPKDRIEAQQHQLQQQREAQQQRELQQQREAQQQREMQQRQQQQLQQQQQQQQQQQWLQQQRGERIDPRERAERAEQAQQQRSERGGFGGERGRAPEAPPARMPEARPQPQVQAPPPAPQPRPEVRQAPPPQVQAPPQRSEDRGHPERGNKDRREQER